MSFIEERREEYEIFLVEIPMLLDDLQDVLKNSKNYRSLTVSFDDDTIKAIEKFYCSVLSGEEDLLKSNISLNRLKRILLAYIGETVLERMGRGKWALNDLEGTSSYGCPEIIEWTEGDHMPVDPVRLLDAIEEGDKIAISDCISFCLNKDAIFEELNEIKRNYKKRK
jgi:hypothetical protein